MKHTKALLLALLVTLAIQAHASCDCHEVTSWEDLKTLITNANGIDSPSPQKILLCPFSIVRNIDNIENHWQRVIRIKKPMHISCQKQSPSDSCSITVMKSTKCQFNENCGRQMFKIRTSNVIIDGLKITEAKDNIISIDSGVRNVIISNLELFKNTVPGNAINAPTGLIHVNEGSSVQILESNFSWNHATVVENKGSVLMHSTRVANNRIRTSNGIGGAITNKRNGELVISSTSFEDNRSYDGPAIYALSETAQVIDAGLNCASGNKIQGTGGNECNGVEQVGSGCTPLVGGQCQS